MKKLAARDFEDILLVCSLIVFDMLVAFHLTGPHLNQCSIPVFEQLLPEPYNSYVLTMLFELCQWHAFAKLALHSDNTLTTFETATKTLGQAMRRFLRHVCPYFETRELPRETESRKRRKKAKTPSHSTSNSSATAVSVTAKTKVLNLNTSKYHNLGHYPKAIRSFGPTDNYNTKTVGLPSPLISNLNSCQNLTNIVDDYQGELEHRRLKQFYARTNKNSQFASQVASEVRRQAIINKIGQSLVEGHSRSRRKQRANRATRQRLGACNKATRNTHRHGLYLKFRDVEPLSSTSPRVHTHISEDQRHSENIEVFTAENDGDPACEVSRRFESLDFNDMNT